MPATGPVWKEYGKAPSRDVLFHGFVSRTNHPHSRHRPRAAMRIMRMRECAGGDGDRNRIGRLRPCPPGGCCSCLLAAACGSTSLYFRNGHPCSVLLAAASAIASDCFLQWPAPVPDLFSGRRLRTGAHSAMGLRPRR